MSLEFLFKKYFNYINDLYFHIELCANDNIISISERNNLLKQINKLVNMLNEEFKNCSHAKINNNNEFIYEKINNEIYSFMNLFENANIHYEFSNLFKNIHYELCELSKIIGFKSLTSGMEMLYGVCYKSLFSYEIIKKIVEINMLFVPLKYFTKKINIADDTNYDEIFIKKSETSYVVLLNNTVDVHIYYNDVCLIFTGYIKYDAINIMLKTSTICNSFLNNVIKKIENETCENCENNDFKKQYVSSLTLHEIVIYEKCTFYEKLSKDYEFYKKIINMPFSEIMNEFISCENITDMHNIIKLLLLGSSGDAKIAGLLFGIIKDKKLENNVVANIIYKNLSYVLQIRLRNMTIDIKNELEKIKKMSTDNISLEKQLFACKNIPEIAKRAAIEKIKEMTTPNNEYYKQYSYVKTIINFPWSTENKHIFLSKNVNDYKKYMEKINKILDEEIYGHYENKEEIQQLLARWFTNSNNTEMAMGLVGPPGIGKTIFAKAISKALDIPLIQINLGGQNDGDLLHGHSYTYSCAQPGMIVKKMVEVKSNVCIIFFDELDKISCKHDTNEISNILLHLIDKSTNNAFQDRFFAEITFPLDKAIFIFSYNDSSKIDKILFDRIKEIKIQPYSINDKIVIASKYIIKNIKKNLNFQQDVYFDENLLCYLIENYTKEAGVRDLYRKIEQIFLKMNVDKLYNRYIFENLKSNLKIIIEINHVDHYLNQKNLISYRKIHTENLVGFVNGLYATINGDGGILPIQVFENFLSKKFILKITGNQKKIMHESCICSFTVAMSILTHTNKTNFYNKFPHGLHIHTPDSSPKDGPSAGVSLTIGILSRILNKKINRFIAITGEIELTGDIKAIGGLQYKLYGAKKAGITTVFIPKDNEKDLYDIISSNKSLNSNFNVICVSHIKQILPHILIDYDISDFDFS